MTMKSNAESTPTGGDPFERALAREEAYRERRSRSDMFGFPTEIFRTFKWLGAGAIAAWAGLLSAHWLFLRDPRWLAILHTMVFGVGLIYVGTLLVAFTIMRRKPEAFGLVDE